MSQLERERAEESHHSKVREPVVYVAVNFFSSVKFYCSFVFGYGNV